MLHIVRFSVGKITIFGKEPMDVHIVRLRTTNRIVVLGTTNSSVQIVVLGRLLYSGKFSRGSNFRA